MSWVRLDAGYFAHPRVITAGYYGWQVHLAAIVLCKQFGWGGRVPKESLTAPVVARTLCAPAGSNVTKRYAEGIASCLSSGLIEDAGTYYQVRDWDQYQQDPLGVARQARFREKQKSNVSLRCVTEDVTGRDVTGRDEDNPPTPSGGSGAKELSPRERSRIEAGCRAIAADGKADHDLRTVAAELGNAVRLGRADPVKARAFWRSKINPHAAYRVPALTAGGSHDRR